MTESKHAVGVDWASGYWLAVQYRDGKYDRVLIDQHFEPLWDSFDPKPDQLLVDVPIGLFDEADDETGERGRECDALARTVLGSRWSSVFTPPARQAAYEAVDDETNHATVSDTNREIVDKGLSIQAYHIAEGIADVDEFLRSEDGEASAERRETIKEAHPEVCFAAFADEPLEHSKTSAVGFGERLTALENVVDDPGETFRRISRDLLAYEDDHDVAAIDPDDVLDALVLAIAAGADEDEQYTLPTHPPKDHHGIPMQMVYRAEKPFEAAVDADRAGDE